MTTALVVDDSQVDQRLAGRLLKDWIGLTIKTANDGRDALDQIEAEPPDLVVTDLQMPALDGLQLVAAIRERYPAVPVILMTAHGSEEIASEALRTGAASYVPKQYLSRDLAQTAERVLALTGTLGKQPLIADCHESIEHRFVLDNDPGRLQPLISYLRQDLARMRLCDQNDLTRVSVALDEAMSNAIYHGNLGLSSELCEMDIAGYHSLAEERRKASPFAERRVYVTASIRPQQAVFVVRDDGEGFDPADLPDPTDPANLDRVTGRGLLLIRTFMDDVRHNDVGNEITMIKNGTLGGD